jgi:predicted ATPase
MHTQTCTFGPFWYDARKRQLLGIRRSTLDLLMSAAAGRQSAKLLVIGSCRPSEVGNRSRSVAHMVDQLLLSETRDTLRQFIQQLTDQLQPAEQKIVEAASIAGMEFCPSQVAAALRRHSPEVEMACAAMAQAGRLFERCGWSDWPDGTVCPRYRFLHSLYREAIYKRLPAGRRGRWHLRIGEHTERALAGQTEQASAELAHHFQRGGDAQRAIHYRRQAAQQCLERRAAPAAVFHITRGLKLLRRILEQKERKQLALELRKQYRKAQALMENSNP